jgi:2-amino-4-hydroxy-6-hydroxymethyldihydropteridine diphosphokinase
MGTLALIGLGSNLGDRKANLDGAVAALSEEPDTAVRAVSSYHETKPVGGPAGQRQFLNAAAALETGLEPIELLCRTHAIEQRFGRSRIAVWGERTLDLDLLLFGEQVIDRSDLVVPHPRMAVRRFVLAPLDEIAPEAIDPITGWTISGLLKNLDRRPSYVALQRWSELPGSSPRFRRIVQELDAVGFSKRDALQLGEEPYATCFDPDLDPDESLNQMVEWLSLDRWSHLGDRWLVTDFSYREILIDAGFLWDLDWNLLTPFIERLQQREPFLIQPTFMVGGHRGPGTPCLRLGSVTPEEEISEILSACAATRP